MNKYHQKKVDNNQFSVILYKNLNFEGKNNIISIKLNQFNNCCLYSIKNKKLVLVK